MTIILHALQFFINEYYAAYVKGDDGDVTAFLHSGVKTISTVTNNLNLSYSGQKLKKFHQKKKKKKNIKILF